MNVAIGEFTSILNDIRAGAQHGETDLYQRVISELKQECKRILVSKDVHNEEVCTDLVSTCFRNACLKISKGEIACSSGLWIELLRFARLRAISYVRDVKDEISTTGFSNSIDAEENSFDIEQVFNESLEMLYHLSEDRQSKEVIDLSLQGKTLEEIASDLGVATRTVERRTRRLRMIWQEMRMELDS